MGHTNATFDVTAADIQKYPWHEIIEKSTKREMHSYYGPLYDAATACQDSGDQIGLKVYRFIGGIASLRPTFHDSACKYQPLFSGAITLEQYQEGDLDTLEQILPNILDSEFKARVADILWLQRKKKNPAHATIAVSSFLKAAEMLEEEYVDQIFTLRIKRAFDLSAQLGTNKELFKTTVIHIDGLIEKYSTTGNTWVCGDLIEILLQDKESNASKHAQLCGKVAMRLETESEFTFARTYWQLQANCFLRLKDDDSANIARKNAAKTFIDEADAATKRPIPSFSAARNILSQGIEAMRQAGVDKSVIEQLRHLHTEYAKQSLNEMVSFSVPMPDSSEAISRAIRMVSGQSLPQALFNLATVPCVSASALRKSLIESENALSLLFGATYLNEAGKPIGRSDGLNPTSQDLNEAHLKAKMFERAARVDWPLRVHTFIMPGLQQIFNEQNVELGDLSFLVDYNLVVEPGRQEVVARGILAGIRGDWVIAAHLIPPQIEHMIRYLLVKQSIITSRLDCDGIESEYPLGKLLAEMPVVGALIGEDLLFELRGLLVEKPGSNLRNRMAHGLMSDAAFYDTAVAYLWWIFLKLCFLPTMIGIENQQAASAPTEAEKRTPDPSA